MRKAEGVCPLDDCGLRLYARGWCRKHYDRWRTHGDPAFTSTPNRGEGFVNPEGYVFVRAIGHPLAQKSGYIPEHRKVVYDAGIEIPSGYSVHHINHDRADNRLENLEVLANGEHSRRHRLEEGRGGTHCRHCGGADWYIAPGNGKRFCRDCVRRYQKARKERLRVAAEREWMNGPSYEDAASEAFESEQDSIEQGDRY